MQHARRWLDTHVHVSDRGSDGAIRNDLAAELRQVLTAAAADLRFVISPDAYWNTVVRDEAARLLRLAEA